MNAEASPDPGQQWRSALDAFKDGVDSHRTLAETGEPPATSPWPPAELPSSPLPEELREEAEALLAAAEALSDAMSRQLTGLPMRRVRSKTVKKSGGPTWTTIL